MYKLHKNAVLRMGRKTVGGAMVELNLLRFYLPMRAQYALNAACFFAACFVGAVPIASIPSSGMRQVKVHAETSVTVSVQV